MTYLAVTQRIGFVEEIFSPDGPVVVVETPPPPPPTPVVRTPTPPTANEPQQVPVDETAPQTSFQEVVLAGPPSPPAPFITNAAFLERPSGRDFERYFPDRALARGQSGNVVLDCVVGVDGRVNCTVASEDPVGWGFGEASLRAARHFRVAPATRDGAPTSGGRLRVPMTWRAANR